MSWKLASSLPELITRARSTKWTNGSARKLAAGRTYNACAGPTNSGFVLTAVVLRLAGCSFIGSPSRPWQFVQHPTAPLFMGNHCDLGEGDTRLRTFIGSLPPQAGEGLWMRDFGLIRSVMHALCPSPLSCLRERGFLVHGRTNTRWLERSCCRFSDFTPTATPCGHCASRLQIIMAHQKTGSNCARLLSPDTSPYPPI